MGYVPDVTARRLQKGRTDTIGFVIPTFGPRFSDPYFSELLAGIGNEAARHGYDVLLSTVAPGPAEIEVYRRQVQSRRVDGMLVVRTRSQDPRIAYLVKAGFPLVAFGHTDQDLDYPWVDVDGVAAGRLVLEHLLGLGHRRIGYLRAPADLMFSQLRWQGFQQAMVEHCLTIPEEWILHGDLSQASGFEMASRLLDHANRPTALVTANDLMALGAMAAAQQRGLEVGSDLSVIGFDDIAPAEHAHPPLTTVHQPIYRIGTMITAMLVRILEKQELDQRHILLEPKLAVRQSTGPAPA
jgi:LacI family transcriptional regulator